MKMIHVWGFCGLAFFFHTSVVAFEAKGVNENENMQFQNPFAQSPASSITPPSTNPVQTPPFGTPPVEPQSPFGTPATQTSPFGTPVTQTSPFGTPPVEPQSPFGTPVTQTSPFGAPPVEPKSPFGTPVTQTSPFGAPPVEPKSPFSTPATQTPPFGAPAEPKSPFGAPAPKSPFSPIESAKSFSAFPGATPVSDVHPQLHQAAESFPGAKTVQAAPKAVPKAVVTFDDTPSSGLDTINITGSGNWLEKRIWFQKSEKAFDQIRTIVSKAIDARVEFVERMNAINTKIDSFYEKVSFDKGQIDELLQNASKHLAHQRTERGDLSSEETSIHAQIYTEKKSLVALGQKLEQVSQFDEQLDKTMGQVFKIIDECRALETKAWEQFKEIGAELDDQNARVLYYTIENESQNIQQNVHYLQTTLMNYFQNDLISELEQTLNTITSSVTELHTKGINIEQVLSKQTTVDEEIEKQRVTEAEEDAEQAWEAKQEASLESQAKTKQPQKHLSNMVEQMQCVICSIPCGICFMKDWAHDQICYWYFYLIGSHGPAMQEYAQLAHAHTQTFILWFHDLCIDLWHWCHDALCSMIDFLRSLICDMGCMLCDVQCWICSKIGNDPS